MNEPILEKCDKCNVTLTSLEEIKKHKKMHTELVLFACSCCSESFIQVTKLLKHVDQMQHFGLSCGICHIKVETEEDMQEHLMSHRMPGRPFSCLFCEAKFRSNRELGLHILKHTDNLPFMCPVCQKGFKWKQVLKMHMMTHSDEAAQKCHICEFSSKHKSTMVTHINRHQGRSFACTEPGCKFKTARKQNLREHSKHHMKETPFHCTLCPKQFSQKKNLTRHLAGHNPLLPVLTCPSKCEGCNFVTSRRDKLMAHVKARHTSGFPLKTDTLEEKTKPPIGVDPSKTDDGGETRNELWQEARPVTVACCSPDISAPFPYPPLSPIAYPPLSPLSYPPLSPLPPIYLHPLPPEEISKAESGVAPKLLDIPVSRDDKEDSELVSLLHNSNANVIKEGETCFVDNIKAEGTDISSSEETIKLEEDPSPASASKASFDPEFICSVCQLSLGSEEALFTHKSTHCHIHGQTSQFIQGAQILKNELCIDTFRYVSPPNVTVTSCSAIYFPDPPTRQSQLAQISPSDLASVLNEASNGVSETSASDGYLKFSMD